MGTGVAVGACVGAGVGAGVGVGDSSLPQPIARSVTMTISAATSVVADFLISPPLDFESAPGCEAWRHPAGADSRFAVTRYCDCALPLPNDRPILAFLRAGRKATGRSTTYVETAVFTPGQDSNMPEAPGPPV